MVKTELLSIYLSIYRQCKHSYLLRHLIIHALHSVFSGYWVLIISLLTLSFKWDLFSRHRRHLVIQCSSVEILCLAPMAPVWPPSPLSATAGCSPSWGSPLKVPLPCSHKGFVGLGSAHNQWRWQHWGFPRVRTRVLWLWLRYCVAQKYLNKCSLLRFLKWCFYHTYMGYSFTHGTDLVTVRSSVNVLAFVLSLF